MKKKKKRYSVNGDESLCMAVSVVKSPAVESDFVFMNKEEESKYIALESGDKHMIYGCALRPDFPIYRNDGHDEYYLEFSKESIDRISKNYFKMGFQSNWTAAHKDEVEGITITESWIKSDMDNDKSVAIGLDKDLPVGTWFIGAYCENEDIWNKVKEGQFKGFSIEAIVGLEELEKNSSVSYEDAGFWEKMKQIINEALHPVQMEEETPAPTVEEPTPTVEEPAPQVEETPAQEENKGEQPKQEETPAQEENKGDDALKHLEDIVKSLKDEISELKKLHEQTDEKVKDLGKKPSAKPLNPNSNSGAKADNFDAWREQMRKMIE